MMKVPQHNSTLKADTDRPLTRHKALSASGGSRKRSGFTPASPVQRSKVYEQACIVTGHDRFEATVDPAHLWPRSKGGCDSVLCVVPLARHVHRAFDDGKFDLLPYLRPSGDERRWLPEILHALEHAEGDLVGLLERLTGERVRWASDVGLRERAGGE